MLKDGGAMVLSLVGGNKEKSVMLDKLNNGIFAPLERNGVCENIGIVHAGNNDSDIDKSSIITEVGKPKNVFEGYNNGNSTLIVVSGLDYPVSHVAKLGDIAKSAYEERRRSRTQSAQKLGNLSFMEEDETPKTASVKKTSSKLEQMRKLMKKQ